MNESCPIIAFTAGKGGCGKTTLAVNFAYNVYKANKKILLIDFDLANKGSSGVFADIIVKKDCLPSIALTDLLDFENKLSPDQCPVYEVKNGYYFLPSSHPGIDAKSELYEKYELEQIIMLVKGKLQQLISLLKIDCVILDCFCGIDILTTAAICMSSDAIFINEPDIVTFTGTLSLHRHILSQLAILTADGTFSSPKIHLIINRLKPEFTIAELNIIYKKNLLIEFKNGVECHFPYNENIFKNFGKYPFWEDLIPKSLFVDKMKLLSWKIFAGGPHANLLRKDVAGWTEKKANRIYFKSHDFNAIDSETLVLQFTDLITYAGLLVTAAIIHYIITDLTHSNPISDAIWLYTLITLSILLFLIKLIWPLILATKLSFSVASFQYRLRKRTGKIAAVYMLPIYFKYFKASFMVISLVAFFIVLIKMIYDITHPSGGIGS
jgi:cellulose biosynthesis protein BcsQ